MTPPKVIYIPLCGEFIDKNWNKDRVFYSDVAYFSEQSVREAGFAILNQVRASLDSNYGIFINSARITEDIIQVLKGASDD